MIEEISEQPDNQQMPQANPQFIAVRTHFYLENVQQAEKVIDADIIKKIEAGEEALVIGSSNLPVTLKKKLIHKPLHLLKIRRRVGKKSKQTSYVIENCTIIKDMYDFEDMCDFVSSQGTDIIRKDDKYSIPKENLLKFVKEKWERRVINRSNNNLVIDQQEQKMYQKLIRPEYFLKGFNLAPPKCDFFVNKIKHNNDKQFINGFTINYQDPIPTLQVEIPSAISKSELFTVISEYLSKRPCWLKNVLQIKLKQDGLHGKYTMNELKNVLKYLCYTYKNGPWKHTFCALSFNPKTTFKAVIYQSVSLKLKKKQAQDYEEDIEQELYDPTFMDISSRCIRSFQIGDISLDEIKEILQGKLISQQTECTKQHGWLSATEHAHILKAMRLYKDNKLLGDM